MANNVADDVDVGRQVPRRSGHAVRPDGRRVGVRHVPRPRDNVPRGAAAALHRQRPPAAAAQTPHRYPI